MRTSINAFWLGCVAAYLISIPPGLGAQKVTVTGTVKAISSDEAPINGVKVEIFELNSSKLTRKPLELEKSVLSNATGDFKWELEASELPSESIYRLALKLSANGYYDSYLSIGPLPQGSREPFESHQTVYLRPKQTELHEVKVASLHLNDNRTIFREKAGPRKRFSVPSELHQMKFALGAANWDPNSASAKQVMKKLQPVTGYVIVAAGFRPLDPKVGYIFADHSGYRLLRMILPGGKSFTTGLEKMTDEDRWLRAETFRVVGSILDESESLSLPPDLRVAIKEYGPLFRGYFEPILVLEVENRGSAQHIIDQIIVEISDVEVYLGPDEKAGVPMQTHDVFVEPKVGAVPSRLATPLRLQPSGDSAGRDVVRFQVRLNPLTPYLHYYKIRLVLLTRDYRSVATEYFEIDM